MISKFYHSISQLELGNEATLPHVTVIGTIENLGKYFGFKVIGEHYPYLETPYSSFEEDYKNFLSKKTKISPPFWGSMMTLILSVLGKSTLALILNNADAWLLI